MIIFIDFDRTLFNTDAFIKDLSQFKRKTYNGKSKIHKKIQKTYFNVALIYFRVIIYTSFFMGNLRFGKRDLRQYLYDDVLWFLEKHKDKELILITFGSKIFQRAKVEWAGIDGSFSRLVYVGLNPKGPIIKDLLSNGYKNEGRPVLFVDDNPDYLESVQEHNPEVTLVRMKQEGSAYNDETFEGACEVVNIRELDTFITSRYE